MGLLLGALFSAVRIFLQVLQAQNVNSVQAEVWANTAPDTTTGKHSCQSTLDETFRHQLYVVSPTVTG